MTLQSLLDMVTFSIVVCPLNLFWMNTFWGWFPREPTLETTDGSCLAHCSSHPYSEGLDPSPPPTFEQTGGSSRLPRSALFPWGRHQVLQLLQSAQKLLDIRSSCTATGPGVDAVSEGSLVSPSTVCSWKLSWGSDGGAKSFSPLADSDPLNTGTPQAAWYCRRD